ncbi:hypothetical protein GQR58_010192 [Nymphon striatum]|nr:hypothetical protein GQR58_010192 [Nymphon striatum]
MLISYFYQSKIISKHIVEWEQPPIRNLDDLTKSNTYYPVFRSSTAQLEIVMNSSDSSYTAIKNMILSDNMKHIINHSPMDGSDIEADGKVFILTMLNCKIIQKSDPNLIILEEEFIFMQLKENGVIQRFYKKYFEVKEKSASLDIKQKQKQKQITLDDRADLAVSDISMTTERKLAVEYSPAIVLTSNSAIYRNKGAIHPSLKLYMAPFTIGTWICLASGLTIIILLIIVLKHKFRFFSSRFSVWTVLSSVTCQGTEFVYKSNGEILLHFTLILFGMLISYFYQSKIISKHIVEWEQPPIRNLDDLTKSNTYFPVFRSSTAQLEIIMNSSDSSYSAIKNMILSDNMKHIINHSPIDGSDIEADGKVFILTMLNCKIILKSDPNLIILEEKFMHGGNYFVWQKNLTIAPILKRTFMQLKENGVIQRFYKKYFEVKEKSASLDIKQKQKQITLDDINSNLDNTRDEKENEFQRNFENLLSIAYDFISCCLFVMCENPILHKAKQNKTKQKEKSRFLNSVGKELFKKESISVSVTPIHNIDFDKLFPDGHGIFVLAYVPNVNIIKNQVI